METDRLSSTLVHARLLLCLGVLTSGCDLSLTGGGVDGLSEDPDDSEQDAWRAAVLEEHNGARADAFPAPDPALSPLVYDEALEVSAQGWADQCVFEHDVGDFGENLYAALGDQTADLPTLARFAISGWESEEADWTYGTFMGTDACSNQCGHYTQMVWRETTAVGCAAQLCNTGSPFNGASPWTSVVCRYDPAGNFVGVLPY